MVEDSEYGAMLFSASVSAMRKSFLRFVDLVSIEIQVCVRIPLFTNDGTWSVTNISSRARRAECPIRHSARQKSEFELEPRHDFTFAESSRAPLSKPVTSSSS
jgi:hypothetical protein